ncbi:MAG: insulinase family protein [Alphaproteobacteria bacterium]|nr:insulinase family protein [Alphaproteobacteria bacterium]
MDAFQRLASRYVARTTIAVFALTLLSFGYAVADVAPAYLSWPQDQTDIKPDPAVRYGVLPNGMRYEIMHNNQPEGVASVRLRIAAGSLQEADNQRGIAHFIEHMAFNGTKNFPEGEAFLILQRMGLSIGPHVNAQTDFGQTIYSFDVPGTDDATLGVALKMLREMADRLLLDPAAIDRERGVIQSEERSRAGADLQAALARLNLWFEGQRYAVRFPIGDMATIRSADRDLLADYYHRYYRPERALIVVVGDVDPAQMEKRLQTMFSDWSQPGEAGRDPDFGTVKHRGLVAGHMTDPALAESVTISWIKPNGRVSDSRALRRESNLRAIAFTTINRRLNRIARQSNAPFIGANIERDETQDAGIVASLGVSARTGQWQTAMAAAEQELRRAITFGLSQAEVDREAAENRAPFELAAANAGNRRNGALATALVEAYGDREVFTDPRQDLAYYDVDTKGVKAEDVNAVLRSTFGGEGPVVFYSGPTAVTDDAVRAAYEKSVATTVTPPVAGEAKKFTYTNFGAPGKVVAKRQIFDLGVTAVRFANGVKLNVKSTNFENDKVGVTVRFAGGYLSLARSKPGLGWALPFAFVEGGLGRLDKQELELTEPGRFAGVDLDIDEDAFELTGQTVQRDLLLQMQILAAYTVDAAYRTDGLERLQAAGQELQQQLMANPSGVLSRELSAQLHDNDPRWVYPTPEEMRAITINDVRSAMTEPLESAPIEITIVGQVKVDAAIDAVAKTFGALPARNETYPLPDEARDVHFPRSGKQLTFYHTGRADQAIACASWPAPDFYSNVRASRAESLVREMLEIRLTEEFRETQGATYVPFAQDWASSVIKGYGFLTTGAETRPDQVEAFFKTLDKIEDELREGKFSDDLVARARNPALTRLYAQRNTNAFWQGVLSNIQTDDKAVNTIRSLIPDVESIKREEIVAAAKLILDENRRIDMRILPKK